MTEDNFGSYFGNLGQRQNMYFYYHMPKEIYTF